MFAFLAPLFASLFGPAAAGTAAAGAGAAAAGAAGAGAATGIGALLGNAWLPALGTGIGTLLTGGSGQDAMRNALMAGAGSMLFPSFGKSASEGLAGMFGIGGEHLSGPGISDVGMRGAFPPPPRPTAVQTAAKTAAGGMSPVKAMEALGPMFEMSGRGQPPAPPPIGAPQRPEDRGPTFEALGRAPSPPKTDIRSQVPQISSLEDLEVPTIPLPGEEDILGGVDISMQRVLPFVDPYTGRRYATKQERDDAVDRGREAGRLSDMQTSLDLAADEASAGDIFGSMDLLDMYNRRARPGLRGFAMGGEIEGPGTGTSDSIPAQIYQNGKPVQKAALSDGEFVMTAKAVKGAGNGSRDRGVKRMYELMRRFESGEMA